ncbi:unnamed protein product [Lactuca saligna]|uniref:ubiquitinyl hydrolase 1 n=1 Tax=Lactuca saligna TaxID=75948 RepID=A0AA36DX42_LACSI|nr:unnamed protein product [Lactuca saligna]
MTWQTSLLLKKRKNGPPLGFKNLGNTYYLNAVIQCLTYTPPLANFYLRLQHSKNGEFLAQQDKKSDCPFCLLEKRIVRSLSIDSTLDTPGKIIGGLKVFAEHFRLGRQEDAHEFLRYIIDACHITCLLLKKLQQQRRKYVRSTYQFAHTKTRYERVPGTLGITFLNLKLAFQNCNSIVPDAIWITTSLIPKRVCNRLVA